MTHIAGC